MSSTPPEVPEAPDPDDVDPVPDVPVAYTDFESREPIAETPSTVVSEAVVAVDGTKRRVRLTELRDRTGITAREFVAAADEWDRVADHDHAAAVLDWGKKPRPWIATERLTAGSLSDRVGAVDLPQACWIGITVAAALRYGHESGVVHGAVTPATIRFRPAATDWDFPKLIAWGLDHRLQASERADAADTARYVAPEQLDPDEFVRADPRTDVYRLGIVFYELLTGESPYVDGGDRRDAVRRSAPVPPTTIDPSLPRAVDDVVLGALEKDPADRYQSIVGFREELVALLEAEHVESEGPDPTVDEQVVEAADVDVQTFPMFDQDRAEWTADCPSCGRSVNNTLSSFVAHWVESSRCDGPPGKPPASRSPHDEAAWAVVLEAFDAAEEQYERRPEQPTTSRDHPLWSAIATSGRSVVAVDGIPVENVGGSFPWLRYPRHGWRVPCPNCGARVFNERSAMLDHWTDAPACTGPPDEFTTT